MSDPPSPILFVSAALGKFLPVGWLFIKGSDWGEMSAVIVLVHTASLSSPLIAVVSALGFSVPDTSSTFSTSLLFSFSDSLPEREAKLLLFWSLLVLHHLSLFQSPLGLWPGGPSILDPCFLLAPWSEQLFQGMQLDLGLEPSDSCYCQGDNLNDGPTPL